MRGIIHGKKRVKQFFWCGGGDAGTNHHCFGGCKVRTVRCTCLQKFVGGIQLLLEQLLIRLVVVLCPNKAFSSGFVILLYNT